MFRLSFAAFALVLVGSTAFALLPRSQSSGIEATVAPSPSPSISETVDASPSPMSLTEYRTARDAICHAAGVALNPLKLRFLGAFDGTASNTQLEDWTSALDQFSAGYDQLVPQLSALQPPAELTLGHGLNVLDIEEQNVLIRRVALQLRLGDFTGASTDDAATNPIGARTVAFERANTLEPCP
jgi:hypothetical protein